MNVLELFGGIGACSKALERLGVEYEIADYVEIDKYAVRSFNAMHDTNFEPQDIRDWDKDLEVDLIMHGSPCQDFSVAGLGKGGDEGSGTRSSLMYETVRIVEKLKPKYVIWENVKNVLSEAHVHNFSRYLEKMELLGYRNHFQVLNAKDYGIPQNRERVFCVSIRKDVNKGFCFPKEQELKLRLKDILEDNVDEKYFLSEEQLKSLEYGKRVSNGSNVKLKQTDMGIASCLVTMSGGHRQPFIRINNVGKIKDWHQRGGIIGTDGLCSTLTATDYKTPKLIETPLLIRNATNAGIVVLQRIRKLTPKEYWRLMGFDDKDFEKAEKVNSNTQLYKQAGNSIVVNVLEAILKNLLIEEMDPQERQLNIYDYL